MGERVRFGSNGQACEGYLATPAAAKGPAVVVVQEWWGLVPHIEDLVNRFAAEGFIAMAPDLYHGKSTTSPDEAGKLLMEVNAAQAQKEIAGAGGFLLSREECSSKKYGVVGFCMGGALAQYSATRDQNVGAAVSFYGGFKKLVVEWERLDAPLLLIYGENDKGVPAQKGRELHAALQATGKHSELIVYPNVGHGFFNDARPQVYNAEAAQDAWTRTLAFLRQHLG